MILISTKHYLSLNTPRQIVVAAIRDTYDISSKHHLKQGLPCFCVKASTWFKVASFASIHLHIN
ncbi:MAG: hypothetical protein RL660_1 [Bacteroidota bacterium]